MVVISRFLSAMNQHISCHNLKKQQEVQTHFWTIRLFHINRRSNDQSSWTRAVGRASHFSSQIHLTRVLALIYSAALPRGDVPHLHVRRLITQYRVREQKVQHIVFLSRSVLNYEMSFFRDIIMCWSMTKPKQRGNDISTVILNHEWNISCFSHVLGLFVKWTYL